MDWKLDKDGYIGLPPGPGLGVEVDEKLIEEAKKPQTYKWPGAKLRTARWRTIEGCKFPFVLIEMALASGQSLTLL